MSANQTWVWIDPAVILAVHDEQLAEHGGAAGVRDAGLLESALARPRNLAHHGQPDVCELAAAYAFGLAENHPFIDGNERSAFVAMELFMMLNGWRLTAGDADCVMVMLNLAAVEVDEAGLAQWLRDHVERFRTHRP
ncbi:MAG: type II toxin-antitoxin system death-on-curing family toxin [Burkholderiaceae bacterium]|nr:type II toxin-antitoxin system death-on-curing family toxin [Burkholderiaceae bacterium]